VHLFARPAFDKPPEWAAGRGCHSVSLYAQTLRVEAHRFYDRLGYERVATSHLFRRALD
jgi:hypothetical protein